MYILLCKLKAFNEAGIKKGYISATIIAVSFDPALLIGKLISQNVFATLRQLRNRMFIPLLDTQGLQQVFSTVEMVNSVT